MKVIRIAALSALAALSASAFAAKPTSVVLNAEQETSDGVAYSTYTVKCSDGSESTLTSWSTTRKWCVGDDSSDLCERKQIKAARKACSG